MKLIETKFRKIIKEELKKKINEEKIPKGFKKINPLQLYNDNKIKWGKTKIFYNSEINNTTKIGILYSICKDWKRNIFTFKINKETINSKNIIAIKY